MANIGVVVTTIHSGVFFGYVESITGGSEIELRQARMCLFWPATVRGVIGLAKTGPLQGARVSPSAPSIHLLGVTSVIEATSMAVAAWEAGPWQ